jgi:hypothetical protein
MGEIDTGCEAGCLLWVKLGNERITRRVCGSPTADIKALQSLYQDERNPVTASGVPTETEPVVSHSILCHIQSPNRPDIPGLRFGNPPVSESSVNSLLLALGKLRCAPIE